MLVAGVLVMAPTASAEIWATRRDAQWRRLDYRIDARASKPRLSLRNRCVDFFSGEDKWYEYGLPAAAFVGWQTGKAVSAIN